MAQVSARWYKIVVSETLQRSSQIAAVIRGKAYIFGGELRPREPRDNDVYVVDIAKDASQSELVTTLSASSKSPSSRVGAASTTLGGKLYMFSGRGGVAMTPVEEEGSLWVFDPSVSGWHRLGPLDTTQPYPQARSYHVLANDGKDIIYVHAGCAAKGRLSDIWSFSVSRRAWTELTPAPDPARGGTSMAYSGGLLYRMNGFDGERERGGSLDIYKPESNSWTTHVYTPDSRTGPQPRSVGALIPLNINQVPSLVTLFGECDPSTLGHQGAGKMLDDIWVFDLKSKSWSNVQVPKDENYPVARGWFAAEGVGNDILVQGGLGESNERLGDAWLLKF